MSSPQSHFYEFGPFGVDASMRVLLREGQPISLEPKLFDTLLVLVQSSGRVVTKDELMKAVWPDTFVQEDSLTRNISLLRKLLAEGLNGDQCIETFPKRGYRLRVPVTERPDQFPTLVLLERTRAPLTVEGEEMNRAPAEQTAGVEAVALTDAGAQSRLRRGLIIVAGVTLAGVAVVALYYRHNSWRSQRTEAQRPSSRRSVAVLGFTNLSGGQDERWFSSLLPDELTTELAAGGQLRTIPEENVDRAKKDLSIPPAESYASDTLARLRQNLGADLVVTGSYAVIGQGTEKQVRIDARVQDARNGETVAVESQTGTKSQLFALVSQVGTRLRQDLGVQPLTPGEAQEAQAAMPSNPGAARLYTEGLAALHIRDAVVARDLLQKAVAAEPSYPLGHAALAEAWSALGYDDEARKEAKQAVGLSGKLSREQQLTVEASYHVMSYHWGNAIQTYQALCKFFPDNLEYPLDLAKAQTSAGRSSDAFGTIEALKELPVPVRDDPRIDLAEAAAAGLISEFKQELDAADRAITKSRMEGARLMMARGLLARGSALTALEPPKDTDQLYAAARETFSALGDRDGVAEALLKEGDSLRAQGRFIEARKTDEEALTAFRTIGDQRGVAASLMEKGIAVYHLDESSREARKNFEEALDLSRRIGDKPDLAWALRHLDRFDEALEVYGEIGDKARVATCLDDLAFVASRNGDLAGATAKFDEEIRLRREIGLKGDLAFALCSSGDVLLFRGDLARAKIRYQEALAVFRERGVSAPCCLGARGCRKGTLSGGRSSQVQEGLRRGTGLGR